MTTKQSLKPQSEAAHLLIELNEQVQELLEENQTLRKLVSERDGLARSLADLHARCLELHTSEMELHNELTNLYVTTKQDGFIRRLRLPDPADSDGDGIFDPNDNCIDEPNADQCDSNLVGHRFCRSPRTR